MKLKDAIVKSILALTTVAVLVAGQPIASPALALATDSQRPFSPFGMSSHPMWGRSEDTINRELDELAAAGGHWLRFDAEWRNGEPSRGVYSSSFFTQMDYVVEAARRRGIEVQVNVFGTPGWANGNAGSSVPPNNDADFANFINKLVSTYRGRIKYWEIWNEPNISEFWEPAPDAARYTRLLKAAYTAAKQADPSCVVISGGLSYCDRQYLQEMYDAGAQGYFDLLGVHPYTGLRSPYYQSTQYNREWNFDGIRDMRDTMDANGDTGKHIWASETGWPTVSDTGAVTEAQQAQYVTEAYKRLFEEFPYVDSLLIYNLRNNGTGTSSWENFGLLRRDFSRKPGYEAFAHASVSWWPRPLIGASRNHILRGGTSLVQVRVPPQWRETTISVQHRASVEDPWEETTVTSTAGRDVVGITVGPSSTTDYRSLLANGTPTREMRIHVHAPISLSRPWTSPARITRRRVFQVLGYRSPKSSGCTSLYFYRRIVKRWNGRVYRSWRFCGRGYARNYDYGTVTRYKYAYRLAYPGWYYVRAVCYYDYPNRCGSSGPTRLFYVR